MISHFLTIEPQKREITARDALRLSGGRLPRRVVETRQKFLITKVINRVFTTRLAMTVGKILSIFFIL